MDLQLHIIVDVHWPSRQEQRVSRTCFRHLLKICDQQALCDQQAPGAISSENQTFEATHVSVQNQVTDLQYTVHEIKPGTWDPQTLEHVASIPSNEKPLGMTIIPCPAFQQDEPQIFVHIAQ